MDQSPCHPEQTLSSFLTPRCSPCSDECWNWNLVFADHFSECVEKHAFHTYDEFIKLHGGAFKLLINILFLCSIRGIVNFLA